jgi:hypothetical protein
LPEVRGDQLTYPELISCVAFGGSANCQRCGHHWQDHMRILYELVEETVTVVDNNIKEQLEQNSSSINLRHTALQHRIQLVEEYKAELAIIREAAAKFGIFLQKYSITPYNDSTIEYLDFLIREEQLKVQASGSDRKVKYLILEREMHQHAIDLLTKSMESGGDWNDLVDGGIDVVVQRLYCLKHFGHDLSKLRLGIANTHEGTYRERPYTVRRHGSKLNKGRNLTAAALLRKF